MIVHAIAKRATVAGNAGSHCHAMEKTLGRLTAPAKLARGDFEFRTQTVR